MQKLFASVIIIFVVTSCWPTVSKIENGKFLTEVVPLEEFNSEYDDYNSALPSNKSGDYFFTFSSKRDKKEFFNLVSIPAQFSYTDKLEFHKYTHYSDYFTDYSMSVGLANKANGDFNVLGPKLLSFRYDLTAYDDSVKDLLMFYADDSEGNLEIKYVRSSETGIDEPKKVDILNSSKDDAYPTFSRSGDKIYFCSNREDNFDIYEVTVPRTESERITVESLVNPKQFSIRKMTELSSSYDDKCPYLYDNSLVFVSNRPGGKGGYDIYSSKLVNGKWSTPVNAGDRINTQYDEYRPILPSLNNFTYNLMIFSSDRPGGKGGFDLYMTGLDN